jgi:polyisoprenoid-binding protein YceI
MAITAGSSKLGPENGTLSVRTKKAGAASKAGHNLLIEVTAWSGTLEVGEDGTPSSVELSVDSRSLKVVEGSGGMTSLGDDDKAGITETINEEVLKGTPIEFRSSRVDGSGPYTVSGELTLAGRDHPVSFELVAAGDRITASATVKQSDWGIKPYSALFGTLKVVDEVAVEIDAQLPSS